MIASFTGAKCARVGSVLARLAVILLAAALVASCTNDMNEDPVAPEGAADQRKGGWGPSLQPVDWTGIAHIGIVLVNMDGTPAEEQFGTEEAGEIMDYMFNTTLSVDSLYREMSWGADGFTGEILATVEIDTPYTADCHNTDRFEWNRAAFAAAEDSGVTFDPETYDILMFVYPYGNDCSNFNGHVGGEAFSNQTYAIDIAEVGIYDYVTTPTTTAHEIGHLRGWNHSSTPGNTYGDFSCVMGENYDYGPGGGWLPMRQANVVWKAQAGYIDAGDIKTISSAGNYSVFLAPTERHPSNWPTPDPGDTLSHAVKVVTDQAETYWLSFRDSDYSAFGDDSSIYPYMDRVSVHTVNGNSVLEATLEAGDSLVVDNVIIKAITDGLGSEEYAEVSVLIWDDQNCEEGFTSFMSEDPIYNNDPEEGVGQHLAVPLTIINDNPYYCNSTTYTISVSDDGGTDWVSGASNPGAVSGGDTVMTSVTLGYYVFPPDDPPDSHITVSVSITDPVTSQQDQYEFEYFYDTTNPSTPTGLSAQMTDVYEVTLDWNNSTDATSGVSYYKVQRRLNDGAWQLVGTPTSSDFIDTVYVINKIEYRVRAVDNAGNQSSWSSIVQTGCPKCPPPQG